MSDADSSQGLRSPWFSWHSGALLAALALLLPAGPARADPPIWANARMVKAVQTDCGPLRYLTLMGAQATPLPPPHAPDCKSTEKTIGQVNVATAFLRPERQRVISEPNVDAGTMLCNNGYTVLILGTASSVQLAIRQHPAPPGCNFTLGKLQHLASTGSIAFTEVANGGTMSIKESLALHAKERERAIAECDASPACVAEVRRRSAINAYYECLKPTEIAHTCTRPW